MTDLPPGWEWATVEEVGEVQLGRQRSPDVHTGTNMRPYLRVANVFEDRIDTSNVMSMHFEPEEFERYRLHIGEILLNEGQSPEFLGRPAMYRGDPPDVAFTNSLIRFRAYKGIDPEWALLVFRRHMHMGRFAREARITTNIAHLSATRFKSIEFPVPPLAEQRRIASALDQHLSRVDAALSILHGIVRLDTTKHDKQVGHLRRSLLVEAFAGRLVPQDPADEPASVLLERIRAERAAVGNVRRGRRRSVATPATAATSATNENRGVVL